MKSRNPTKASSKVFRRSPAPRSGRFYHRTSKEATKLILKKGFKDGTGEYLTDSLHTGVWISNEPLDSNEGANGDVLLEVRILRRLVNYYEWLEEGKPYREFLVPAKILNKHSFLRVVEE
jgi:hypothetical protein